VKRPRAGQRPPNSDSSIEFVEAFPPGVLNAGVLDQGLFGVLVLMAICTTLATGPPLDYLSRPAQRLLRRRASAVLLTNSTVHTAPDTTEA
jgi:hypothetical protein